MIYAIDFDGTICPNDDQRPPQKECLEVLRRLKECNHTILIYSCRSNPETVDDPIRSTREMVEYLQLHRIPFDGILTTKPFFNYVIDDRSIGVPMTSDDVVDWAALKKIMP